MKPSVLPGLQSANDEEVCFIILTCECREPMHEESVDNYTVWRWSIIIIIDSSEISIEYRLVIVMQRNNQVYAVLWSLPQTFFTEHLDMHDLSLYAISSLYSSSRRRCNFQFEVLILQELPSMPPERGSIQDLTFLSFRRTRHETQSDIPHALMPGCSQTPSEQHPCQEAFSQSSETTDIDAFSDLKRREATQNDAKRDLKSDSVTHSKKCENESKNQRKFSSLSKNSSEHSRMKNTHNEKIQIQKHRDTGQHTSFKGNISYKKVKRGTNPAPALEAPDWKKQLTSPETIDLQSSDKKWYLEWFPDHPLFRSTTWLIKAIRFYTEGIPPRTHIGNNNQLPAPALPLTRSSSGFNGPAARVEVNSEGPNYTACSAQEQCPNASSDTENITSFSGDSSRARDALGPPDFPTIISADQGNGSFLECNSTLPLRPSNDDQKEVAALEKMVLKWNGNTNQQNSGSEETIPRVPSHPVEESTQSEANNRPTFPKDFSLRSQIATFSHGRPPYLDLTTEQIVEAGLISIDSLSNNPVKCTTVRDMESSMAPICDDVGGAAASTPSPGHAEIQKYLLTDAAQSVLDLGYQPKLVLLAIERVLMKRISEEMSGEMIMEAVFEIEEEKQKKSPTNPSSQSDQGSDSTGKGNEEAEGANGDEFPIDLEKTGRGNRTLQKANLCFICQIETICAVFLPCRDFICCSDCAVTVRKCPICSTLIRGFVTASLGGNGPV